MDAEKRTVLENIWGRLPHRQAEDNRRALGHLLDDPEDLEMTDFANAPQVLEANDDDNNMYLGLCLNQNEDGTYRSPFVKELSTENKVERIINEILKKYIKAYFDSGVANFYLTNRSEADRTLEGVFVVMKQSGPSKKM